MTKENIIDISSITMNEIDVEIKHPGTGAPLGICVTIMSSDDPRLKPYIRAGMDKQNHKARRNKIVTTAEKESQIVNLIAHAITGWTWAVHYKGEIPEFSHAKAVEILSDENIPWFFEQVSAEVGDTERFFQN